MLGFLNWRVGRVEQAVALWEQVSATNPDLILPRLALSVVYEERGRLGDARALVQEIRRVNPELTADVAAGAVAMLANVSSKELPAFKRALR